MPRRKASRKPQAVQPHRPAPAGGQPVAGARPEPLPAPAPPPPPQPALAAGELGDVARLHDHELPALHALFTDAERWLSGDWRRNHQSYTSMTTTRVAGKMSNDTNALLIANSCAHNRGCSSFQRFMNGVEEVKRWQDLCGGVDKFPLRNANRMEQELDNGKPHAWFQGCAVYFVYHGTSELGVPAINCRGFHTGKRGANGQAHGEGEYFARNPNLALCYSDKQPQLLLTAVLLGPHVTVPYQDMVVVNNYNAASQRDHIAFQLPLGVIVHHHLESRVEFNRCVNSQPLPPEDPDACMIMSQPRQRAVPAALFELADAETAGGGGGGAARAPSVESVLSLAEQGTGRRAASVASIESGHTQPLRAAKRSRDDSDASIGAAASSAVSLPAAVGSLSLTSEAHRRRLGRRDRLQRLLKSVPAPAMPPAFVSFVVVDGAAGTVKFALDERDLVSDEKPSTTPIVALRRALGGSLADVQLSWLSKKGTTTSRVLTVSLATMTVKQHAVQAGGDANAEPECRHYLDVVFAA